MINKIYPVNFVKVVVVMFLVGFLTVALIGSLLHIILIRIGHVGHISSIRLVHGVVILHVWVLLLLILLVWWVISLVASSTLISTISTHLK